jgi:hypothetical protein
MKTTIKALVIIFALSACAAPSFSYCPKPNQALSVRVISTKRHIFHFKVDKELIGGTVDILFNNETLIETDRIVQSRTIVDFFSLQAGNYIVRIKKGEKEFTFQYENN